MDIVLGKFLSAFVFLALMTLLSVYMPALILVNGKMFSGILNIVPASVFALISICILSIGPIKLKVPVP